MKRKNYIKILLLTLMALLLVFSCAGVSAAPKAAYGSADSFVSPLDFGNQNDYGDFGGGDYDYGGGGWDYDYDDDDDDNYYAGGSSSGGGGGSSTPGSLIGAIVVFIIIAIIAFVISKKKPKMPQMPRQGSNSGQLVSIPDRTAEIDAIIKEDDPNFSASDFVSFGKEVFVDIQNAWSARDLSNVRVIMHDNLYNQTQKQVDEKIRNGLVNHIENIAVSTAYLTSYKRDRQFEYVTMYLSARFIDYEEEEKTGRVIRGDKNTRWEMRYLMKFMRSTGVKTKEENNVYKSHNCPNCGAPLKMESSGICEYCGSVVTTGQYSWVLSDHNSVRNDWVDEGISKDE